MTIQEKRFGDRIQVEFFLDPALAEKYLPKLILEPVLENAVKHGLGSVTEKGEIRVSSYLQGKYMVFEIADNGVGMDPAKVRQYLEGHDDQHVGSIMYICVPNSMEMRLVALLSSRGRKEGLA